MSSAKKVNSGKLTSSSVAKSKGKTGVLRKEKHLSAENKRNQAARDTRGSGKKGRK